MSIYHHRYVSMFIPVLFLWSLLSGAGARGETVTRWSPVLELSFSNASWTGNAYDVIATATFTHGASGETRTTGLFYDGGTAWKARFTGTRTGVWTWITSSTDPDLDGLSGSVLVTENPGARGFISHDAEKYLWTGTQEAFVPQIVMYETPLEYYNDPERIDADIDTFLVRHGFNGLHTRVYCRWFDLDEETYDTLSDDPDPDPRTFEALELLIQKVYAAGGMVHIWAWGDEQTHRTPVRWGLNGTVDRRLQRYIAARLGPLPGWTLGYGYDNFEWVTETDLESWHTFMQDQMGWTHLLGARDSSAVTLSQIYEDLDVASYEVLKPVYADYVTLITERPGKPSFAEDRFRVRVPAKDKDYTEEETRRGLYHSTLAGGVANIWGYGIPAFTEGYGSQVYPNARWIRTWADFFQDRFIRDMVRDNGITDGVALKRPTGAHYVFYKEDAASIQMDLSAMDGSRPAVAVDTRLAYAEIDIGPLAPENQTWTAPYVSDWVVGVGEFGASDRVMTRIRLFLEGPYRNGLSEMTTYLNNSGRIPLSSPYPESSVTVESIPAGVTDWVLLEIRDDSAGDAVLFESAFLRNDGYLLDTGTGTDTLRLFLSPGTYSLLVHHRNHLSVQTADPVSLSSECPVTVDFTQNPDIHYGSGGIKQMGDGTLCLVSGDGNDDGGIYAEDYTLYKLNQGVESYHAADYNLDGGVYAEDYTLYKINQGLEESIR